MSRSMSDKAVESSLKSDESVESSSRVRKAESSRVQEKISYKPRVFETANEMTNAWGCASAYPSFSLFSFVSSFPSAFVQFLSLFLVSRLLNPARTFSPLFLLYSSSLRVSLPVHFQGRVNLLPTSSMIRLPSKLYYHFLWRLPG